MYPESLLYWLGGIAVLIGIIGVIGMIAFSVEQWYKHRYTKPDDPDSEEQHGVDS